MEGTLNIGRIVNTHGVKGEVKVAPLTDVPERFEMLKKVNMNHKGAISVLTITSVKYFKNTVILKFREVNDMNAAENLKGAMLFVERKDAIKLPEDSFFIGDIIGCEVFDEKRGSLGLVQDVVQTGSNDIYVVRDSGKFGEVLVPALKTVVSRVDIVNKRIDVSLPEGLLDD